MAEFYSARAWEIPPLPWTNLSPPFSEQALIQTLAVHVPRNAVDTGCCVLLQCEVGRTERVRRNVVEERSETFLRVSLCSFPYPGRRLWHAYPTLGSARALAVRFPLVGRLLRREGLYSSHLTEWRRARREGSLQGLTPSKRGRKPAERNPLSAKVHELEAKVARLEKELHTAHKGALEFRSRVGGVGEEVTQPGEAMTDRFEDVGRAVAVLDIG